MSGSVDVHSQLASILDRFAKCALVEMTKIIDKDSALLRAEISRRQMEVEALLCKLQFAESELRSARHAAATRPPAPHCRSVAVQVHNTDTLQEDKKEHSDTHHHLPIQSTSVMENGAELYHVKEEQTELTSWDNEGDVEETQDCWEREQHSLDTSGCDEAKPDIIWDSPDLEDITMNSTQTPETSEEPINTNPGRPNTNVSPNLREDLTIQYQQPTDCNGPAQHRRSRLTNPAAPLPVSEQRVDGAGTGDKSSRCIQCGKTFTTRFYLKIHQRIHTGERPYTCLQCGKRFYCNSHLISHQRCHTGEKPYSCEECGKSYSHLNSLKLHQRSHTEEEVAYNYW
ncbi:zinc finger protein 33B [Trichomycterus rosablanca]|uniref:zinc finger protein 33B n=1 Tax=Trichomycterus rosablanca TaxID=2290929 RepID=UPI002F34F755